MRGRNTPKLHTGVTALHTHRERTAQYVHAENCSDCAHTAFTHTRPVSVPRIPSHMLACERTPHPFTHGSPVKDLLSFAYQAFEHIGPISKTLCHFTHAGPVSHPLIGYEQERSVPLSIFHLEPYQSGLKMQHKKPPTSGMGGCSAPVLPGVQTES